MRVNKKWGKTNENVNPNVTTLDRGVGAVDLGERELHFDEERWRGENGRRDEKRRGQSKNLKKRAFVRLWFSFTPSRRSIDGIVLSF